MVSLPTTSSLAALALTPKDRKDLGRGSQQLHLQQPAPGEGQPSLWRPSLAAISLLFTAASEHVSWACAPTSEDYFVSKASMSIYNTLWFVLWCLSPCLPCVGRWLEEERKATCFPTSSDKHTLSRADRCLKVRSRASIHPLGSAVPYKAFAGFGLMLFDIVRLPSVKYCLVTDLTASIVLHLLILYVPSSNWHVPRPGISCAQLWLQKKIFRQQHRPPAANK